MCELYENTPLHYSASLGRMKMCRILLDNGCDPNHFNKLNQTPLHLAIKHEKLECVELLIAYGADPYIYDTKGCLPHHYAFHLTAEIKKIFIEMEADPKINNIHLNSLAYMSSVGKLDFVKFLLEKGANPNRVNKFGCTPLHLAMFNGQIECSNELVKHGAKVNNLGAIKLTPLDFYLNHAFNSIVNLFHNNNEYKIKLSDQHNIILLAQLEKYHLGELMFKLINGWKFSSFETILLLLVRNLDSGNSTLSIDQLNFNTDGKTINSNSRESASKQLINYFRKIKLLSSLLGSILQSRRNAMQIAFLDFNHDNNLEQGSNDKNSVFWYFNQILTIILNFLHQIIRFKNECKYEKELETLDFEIRKLIFQNMDFLIKSGEIKNSKALIIQSCSKWFFKKFSLNTALESTESINYFLNKKGFEYFEELIKEINLKLSQPTSLLDLCRIELKCSVKNYPNDLEVYDSFLPNCMKKFIRFENT